MPRKTRTRLDKNAVVQAAVEILNAEGVQALTLSRLAEELGIQTPSLYNHVEGLPGLQQELAILNAKLLADRLSSAAMGKSGTELFMEASQAFRAYVKEYPGLYMSTLRSSGAQETPNKELQLEEERTVNVGLVVMASLGLKGENAIHGLRAFRSMVHGFATLEVAGGFGLPQDCDESFRRLVLALVAGLQK
ncbi:MAG TPA: WHG domain-containing protein [Anaerolineales bacterium]|nr:WHG domain-containing protein [Anaerolineales bacterium]HNO94538.1 WHG domain-containing protein [Anaerolineales bacterium]